MIFYEVTCRYCKGMFQLKEGSKQYKEYKVNRNAKFSCDSCNRNIEDDSRKYLFNRE